MLAAAIALVLLGETVVVVEPPAPVSKNVLFVVDGSGSMEGARFSEAVAFVCSTSRQPVDEMNIAVVKFGDDAVRWKGIPEEGVPEGWAALPSEEAPRKAEEFIKHAEVDENRTNPLAGLVLAFNDPAEDLTIILVSDCVFPNDAPHSFLTQLLTWNANRKTPARFFVLGLGYPTGEWVTQLKILVNRTQGGYWIKKEN